MGCQGFGWDETVQHQSRAAAQGCPLSPHLASEGNQALTVVVPDEAALLASSTARGLKNPGRYRRSLAGSLLLPIYFNRLQEDNSYPEQIGRESEISQSASGTEEHRVQDLQLLLVVQASSLNLRAFPFHALV